MHSVSVTAESCALLKLPNLDNIIGLSINFPNASFWVNAAHGNVHSRDLLFMLLSDFSKRVFRIIIVVFCFPYFLHPMLSK